MLRANVFFHILAINKTFWHSGQYLWLRLRSLLREESLHPIGHVETRNVIYHWVNVFEFRFVKIFQMTIITSIKFEHIGLPFIDCLAIRHHSHDGFFLLSFSPLLTYLGHSSVTRVLLQTKDRKTLFEVKIYISPVTFKFSNITVFLDRSPDSWFLLCIPLTTLYFQSQSILLLNKTLL